MSNNDNYWSQGEGIWKDVVGYNDDPHTEETIIWTGTQPSFGGYQVDTIEERLKRMEHKLDCVIEKLTETKGFW